MNLSDTRLNVFLTNVEEMKRNKINNSSFVEKFHYVDPNDYLSKLDASIDHIVFGRRGSGKTTLLQKSVNRHDEKNLCILVDCEVLKKESEANIIIDVLSSIFKKISLEIDEKDLRSFKRRYYINCKSPIKPFRDKEVVKKYSTEYINNNFIYEMTRYLLEKLQKLTAIDEQVEYDYAQVMKTTTKTSRKDGYSFNADAKANLNLDSIEKLAMLSSTIKFSINSNSNYSRSRTDEVATTASVNQKKIIDKKKLVTSVLRTAVEVINTYAEQFNKKIILILDDFYYINRSNQPYVLNYIHQMNKISLDNSFSFKLSVLPNRFQMNSNNEFDLSIKDDFSAINLDRDLSDIKITKDFLLDICSALVDSEISPNDFESIFSQKNVLTYVIIACGGNPRDFLVILEKLIRLGKKNNKKNIGKTMIYSVVYDSISEKENSIEDDDVLSKEKILEAVGLLKTEIINNENTNVFLYPEAAYDKHSFLIRSLIAFGYIHQLKEKITSDYHDKKIFVPFCIDMSLYVTESSMKRMFDFREFWSRDNKSRLIQITSAPKWQFPDEFFEKIQL